MKSENHIFDVYLDQGRKRRLQAIESVYIAKCAGVFVVEVILFIQKLA